MSEFVEGATTPEQGSGESATTDNQHASTESNDSKLTELVGEGKKFSDPEKLASAYQHADQRIEELKLQVEKLTSEKLGVDEVLAELRKQSKPEAQSSQGDATNAPAITEEMIGELVANQVQTIQEQTTKEQKIAQTWKAMDEAFGSREASSQAIKQYIGDDAERKALVNQMAISDPAGLMKLVGKDVERKPTSFTRDNSAGSSQDSGVNLNDKLTWEAAQQVRKTNPKLYYSHAFRRRMLEEL